jgi:hypothetical protein
MSTKNNEAKYFLSPGRRVCKKTGRLKYIHLNSDFSIAQLTTSELVRLFSEITVVLTISMPYALLQLSNRLIKIQNFNTDQSR